MPLHEYVAAFKIPGTLIEHRRFIMPQDADGANSRKREVSRRAVLRGGAALTAIAGPALIPAEAGAQQANAPLAVPDWMKEQGAPILSPPYGLPSEYEKHVVRRYREVRATNTAATTFAPLQELYGIITPNGLCFERHHGGVPRLIQPNTALYSMAWSIEQSLSRWMT